MFSGTLHGTAQLIIPIMAKVLKHVRIKIHIFYASAIWGKFARSENIHQTINTFKSILKRILYSNSLNHGTE